MTGCVDPWTDPDKMASETPSLPFRGGGFRGCDKYHQWQFRSSNPNRWRIQRVRHQPGPAGHYFFFAGFLASFFAGGFGANLLIRTWRS